MGPTQASAMQGLRRCQTLAAHCRHVVSQHGEAALPGFDLNKKVGRKIKLQKYRRAVVLCVVDMADFDGSLPREALQELLPGLEEGEYGSQAGLGYRLVVAASKVDLLPPQATQTRLQVQSCKHIVPCHGCIMTASDTFSHAGLHIDFSAHNRSEGAPTILLTWQF